MISRVLKAVFGSRNDRLLKQYGKSVRAINALEPSMAALPDPGLGAKTLELRERFAKRVQGVPEEERDAAEKGALAELLPESFAVVREAAKRVLNMRHFDVQLIGGMVLHDGKISEMRTGEGKTLVATLPAYLNALSGRGVHIVTVNDYLASRDAEWMGKVYKFLGLSVGVILTQMPHAEKQSAYAADITYGTNNEFGFDYLRDNMAMQKFTGRLMPGRRWSDGLHQAIEAKENVSIQSENQTLASITFQNYFRMYRKLAGMTGTADTEAYEFQEIYGLEVVVVPTHMPMVRADRNDQVFRTAAEKYKAIIGDIKDCHERGQPVLVGTTSIENSELISAMLEKDKLAHQVLNAKQHAREAEIVAQAGRPKVITIATNMAGRGTDIVLGGNVEKQVDLVRDKDDLDAAEKERRISELRREWQDLHNRVIAAGGLHIIGTERHEARRIDNQLRGRSGRQGDPGSSRFYLSLEDPLLRIFAGERVNAIMQRLGMPEGEPIEHGLVTRSIESAQRKVEAHNFDIRKQLLEYDNVANDQRREIYQLRNSILESQDVSDQIAALREGVVTDFFRAHVPEESMEEQWDIPGLEKVLAAELRLDLPLSKWLESDPGLDDDALLKRAISEAHAAYARKMAANPPEAVHQVERLILLSTLDNHWLEHLAALDHLRQGIHLRGYAQKNPKQEYKREAFELFGNLVESVKLEVTRTLMMAELSKPEQIEQVEGAAPAIENVQYQHAGYEEALAGAGADAAPAPKPAPFVRQIGKIGRNDPCPCGSGKKYKHCHGKLS